MCCTSGVDDGDVAGQPVRPTREGGAGPAEGGGCLGPARGPGPSGARFPHGRRDRADPGGQAAGRPAHACGSLRTWVWGRLAEAFVTHCPGSHSGEVTCRSPRLGPGPCTCRRGLCPPWPEFAHSHVPGTGTGIPTWHRVSAPPWLLRVGIGLDLPSGLVGETRPPLPPLVLLEGGRHVRPQTLDETPRSPAPPPGGQPLRAPEANGWWALPRQLPLPAASARLVQSRSTKGGNLFKRLLLALFVQLSGVPTLRFSSDNYVPFAALATRSPGLGGAEQAARPRPAGRPPVNAGHAESRPPAPGPVWGGGSHDSSCLWISLLTLS